MNSLKIFVNKKIVFFFFLKSCAYYDNVIGKATHVPIFGESGLNSGVMFMDLDKLRKFDFENKITVIANTYRNRLVYPDQDLLNILFRKNSSKDMQM